jgi:hypothetical protein
MSEKQVPVMAATDTKQTASQGKIKYQYHHVTTMPAQYARLPHNTGAERVKATNIV